MSKPIETVEEFYAHALAIEREAAKRYAEFAEWLDSRSPPVARLCRRLQALEQEHFDQLAAACATLELPDIPAREYRWLGDDSPETAAREFVYRVATPRQLLEIALDAEFRAQAFFVWIARTAPLRGVRELASVMAAEEGEHVGWVRDALEKVTALT